ncbi:MAG: hypothetical protein INR71_05810, partial [Terriglobus roseus]|nr:hypothetical protein [Terriglobus roseus]
MSQTRRTLSNGTASTSSSGMTRTPSGIHRSGSGRTASSIPPTSYVALMRKQKATVWSAHAQQEDPRLVAAQRQAKMRAAMEVVGGGGLGAGRGAGPGIGGASGGGSSFGGVRSKIRHH